MNVVLAIALDRAQHAVAGGLNQFVEERAELFHAVGDFALHGIFDGFFARVGGVFDELGDFHREAEKYRRNCGDVVRGARAAAQIAAVGVVASGFAAGIYLQRKRMARAGNFLDVAALLDHGEQNVVALVEQGHFVAHLFQLQRDAFANLTWLAWLFVLLLFTNYNCE